MMIPPRSTLRRRATRINRGARPERVEVRFRMKLRVSHLAAVLILLGLALGVTSCGKRSTRVAHGNKEQIFHLGNYAEPADLDPQIVIGDSESHILKALFEGLVIAGPKDLRPLPGVAERWEVSADGRVYTFFLRANAVWSDGEPVVADDFVKSYERILNPKLAAQNADMLFVLKGGEDYYAGRLQDFSKVGVKALDPKRLQINLRTPVPYFLALLNHHSWSPVPVKIVDQHGNRYDKGNRWTRPENLVSNGPFRLKDWKTQQEVVVQKNDKYWDAKQVRLREIHFYPIESRDTEDRAFRAGQLHATYEITASKFDAYKASAGSSLRVDPYYGVYYLRVNIDPAKQTNPALKDVRVRRALSMAIDRESLVRNITRAGERPAFSFVPPGPAGYEPREKLTFDPEEARRLLAEAGYPGGKGMPRVTLLLNTDELHKSITEALQQMWKKELGIEVEIINQEWKVYLATENNLDYQVARAGYTADYGDPNSFFDAMRTLSGNNNTGFASPEYDRFLTESLSAPNPAARVELLQQAEAVLLREVPVIPLYFYARTYLLQPSVKGWDANLIDHHPWKYVYLDESGIPEKLPTLGTAP